jgi:predicted ATPase/DNA-binding CsgD family transcriptional regulator
MGNLPSEVNSFVGRRRELSELRLALGSSRLVTLVGPGGVGKTRLALRIATDLQRSCRDGAWLIEFADVADATQVAKAMLTALGLSNHSGRWPLSLLVDFLAGRDLILVVDNCEHVLDACAIAIGEIMRRTRTVRIVATSRQPLAVAGEAVYPVSGLAVPGSADTLDPAQLPEFGAIALFRERAFAATGTFELNDTNKSSVLELCRRLDGFPLAIELAAVRLRSLTVQEIVSRLGDRFALLRGGGAATPARQRALEATINWSYSLLKPSEQAMLRRLAVFVGSVDVEAAEAVCTGGGVQAGEVLDLISSLVEKSLVYREDAGVHARYRLHETMREYGLVRLRAADELGWMRIAHLRWYGVVAERVEADSFGPLLPDWLRRLDAEASNVRAALQFCLDHPEHVDTGLELAASLHWWWHTRSPAEASSTIQALLRQGGSDRWRGHALRVLGALNVGLGDFELAESALSDALMYSRRAKDAHCIAMNLLDQALLEISAGRDLAKAERDLSESYSLASAVGDAMAMAYARLLMGGRGLAVGQPEAARLNLAAAIEISRAHGDSYLLSQELMVDGIIELSTGSPTEAEANLKESLQLVRRMDNRVIGVTTVLQALAAVALARGHAARAARLQGASSAVIRQQRLPGHHPYVVTLAAATAERAAEMLGASAYAADFAVGERMSLDDAMAFALEEKAEYLPAEPRAARGTELAKREIEVGRLVAEGLTNKEIAARLFLSDRTVESHVRHILNKLGLTSRVQIASWFSRAESQSSSVGSR